MNKISNIKDLRNDLVEVYSSLRKGEISVKDAKEIANAAGKIIASAKVELQYNAMMEKAKEIEFLETGN